MKQITRTISATCQFRSGPKSNCIATTCGYTLIETIVSLVILVSFLIPLLARFHQESIVSSMRREFVGIRLIEQEAAIVRTFPYEAIPIKRRIIGSEEWIIRTAVRETTPLCYIMTVEVREVEVAKAVFYGRVGDDRR